MKMKQRTYTIDAETERLIKAVRQKSGFVREAVKITYYRAALAEAELREYGITGRDLYKAIKAASGCVHPYMHTQPFNVRGAVLSAMRRDGVDADLCDDIATAPDAIVYALALAGIGCHYGMQHYDDICATDSST